MAEAESIRVALAIHRTRVEDLVAALTRELDEIVESAQLANVDDEHDPDGSTIAYERAKATALLAAALRDLDAVDAAMRAADDSTYGTCTSCGRPIGPERLDALLTTTTCIGCAVG